MAAEVEPVEAVLCDCPGVMTLGTEDKPDFRFCGCVFNVERADGYAAAQHPREIELKREGCTDVGVPRPGNAELDAIGLEGRSLCDACLRTWDDKKKGALAKRKERGQKRKQQEDGKVDPPVEPLTPEDVDFLLAFVQDQGIDVRAELDDVEMR